MSSQSQIDANRANAQHSTGPRSDAGKATVSQNATRHGLSSKYLPLSEAERPLFEELEADLRQRINPAGALQESIFMELAAGVWKRSVVNRLISEATTTTESLFEDEPSDRVRKLQRHKADQDRAVNRAMRQLKELQTNSMLQAIMPANSPGLADYVKITKQTQSVAQEPLDPIDPRPEATTEAPAEAPVFDREAFQKYALERLMAEKSIFSDAA
ncbi:MAG: hypothetical protein JST93_18830 [Acidobacteria bacterium]|nr:hypothetical protein [Acidobacteriota bacterium]